MADETPPGTEPELMEFPFGDDLIVDEASAVMSSGPCRFLVVAGAPRCGKTTLLNGIYELFQEGPVGNLVFGGSRTLVGFEKRCHPSREISEAERPDTDRTKLLEEGRFLHLRFYQSDCAEQARHLVMSDIDGEFFKRMRDNVDECKRHPFLRRADRLLVLVDGRKLARPRRRHEALEDAKSLLRSLLDSGMIDPCTAIHVVITKWDYAHNVSVGTQAMVDFVRDSFWPILAGRPYKWTVECVASRPADGSAFAFGHGIPALLPVWLLENPREREEQFVFGGTGRREMERFGRRAVTT